MGAELPRACWRWPKRAGGTLGWAGEGNLVLQMTMEGVMRDGALPSPGGEGGGERKRAACSSEGNAVQGEE